MKIIMPLFAFLIFSLKTLVADSLPTIEYSSINHPVISQTGKVVSQRKSASKVGAEILRNGGNAVDAAVAVGFALAVTSSSNGNIGGGGFMVAAMADGQTFTLDYREKAPAAAHRDMFLNDSGNVIPGMSLFSLAGSPVRCEKLGE